MIGIICAMEAELNGILEKIENPQHESISGVDFVKGYIGGKEIAAAKCGIGKVFAALCAEAMILSYKPDCIINSGVAGGVDRTLDIGDIAVAENVVQYDMDTTALGDPKGLISGLDIIKIPCAPALTDKLLKAADECGFKSKKGTLATGDKFCAKGSAELDEMRIEFNPLTTDMEGAAIGHVCFVNQVPFTVIRALSDKADEEADSDYRENLRRSSEHSYKTVLKFLENN